MRRRPREDKYRWTITYWFCPRTRHRLWTLGLTIILTRNAHQPLTNRTLTGWICTRLAAIRQTRVKWRIQMRSMQTWMTIKGISCRRQLRDTRCFCTARAGSPAQILNFPPHLAARATSLLLMWLRERLFSGLPPLDLSSLPDC